MAKTERRALEASSDPPATKAAGAPTAFPDRRALKANAALSDRLDRRVPKDRWERPDLSDCRAMLAKLATKESKVSRV